MKVLCLVVLACVAAINAQPEKRQLGVLAALEPVISSFVLDKLGLDKFIGKLVGSITALFKGKSGDITIPNSTLKLHYDIHKCHLHIGKRFIGKLKPSEKCKATVSENAITKTSASCETGHQDSALKCAMEAELKKIQALAQQAAKQEAGR